MSSETRLGDGTNRGNATLQADANGDRVIDAATATRDASGWATSRG